MTNDIVARLRALAAEFPSLNAIMDSEWTNAADEIERLHAIVEAWRVYSSRAERDIETLRAERDNARLQTRQIRNLFKEATDAIKEDADEQA